MTPILAPYNIAGSVQKLLNMILVAYLVSSIDYAIIAIDYVITSLANFSVSF